MGVEKFNFMIQAKVAEENMNTFKAVLKDKYNARFEIDDTCVIGLDDFIRLEFDLKAGAVEGIIPTVNPRRDIAEILVAGEFFIDWMDDLFKDVLIRKHDGRAMNAEDKCVDLYYHRSYAVTLPIQTVRRFLDVTHYSGYMDYSVFAKACDYPLKELPNLNLVKEYFEKYK